MCLTMSSAAGYCVYMEREKKRQREKPDLKDCEVCLCVFKQVFLAQSQSSRPGLDIPKIEDLVKRFAEILFLS